MRILFMGTPEFAVRSLESLSKSQHEIIGVVTQPDRPKGRGQKLTPSPVKVAAEEAGIAVYQPEKIKTPEFVGQLKSLNPDLIVVVAFGQLLSKEILELPKNGCINVHASLLPKYRGAAPIHWAVINGETETGITIMQMDEGLDSGDSIISRAIAIKHEDTTGIIHDELAKLGAELLVEAVNLIDNGAIVKTPQDHEKATYAPLLTKATEKIDWSQTPRDVCNLVRGLNPWPGAYTIMGDKVLKIWLARPCEASEIAGLTPAISDIAAGEVAGRVPGTGFAVAARGGCVVVTDVQLQGSKKLKAEEFMRGHNINKGILLG
ncbi:MAG TPA: methionyl-tRNA formyltransferase [Desulfobacteria bacterium]|nr:methionyl-tRNA formyltransferase [Desulfobacteria bacterium]